jgi:hypothetical protein
VRRRHRYYESRGSISHSHFPPRQPRTVGPLHFHQRIPRRTRVAGNDQLADDAPTSRAPQGRPPIRGESRRPAAQGACLHLLQFWRVAMAEGGTMVRQVQTTFAIIFGSGETEGFGAGGGTRLVLNPRC